MIKLITIALLFIIATVFGLETQLSGTNDDCAKFCINTFTPHTNPQSKGVSICQQGCRMFSVLQFSFASDEDKSREECHKSCEEAYGTGELANGVKKADACGQGCDHQKPTTNGRVEVLMDSNSPMFHNAESVIDGFFSKFSTMRDSAFNHFNSFFGDDWNRDPFGEMQKQMERMEETMSQVFKSKAIQGHSPNPLFTYGKSLNSKNKDEAKPLEVRGIAPADNGKDVGNMSPIDGMPIIYVEMNGKPIFEQGLDRFDSPNTVDSLFEGAHEPSPPIDPAIDPDSSWMSCLARRARRLSGATRWLLCLALMLSVIAMLWISLSIIRTAPRQRLLIPTGYNSKKTLLSEGKGGDGGEAGKLNGAYEAGPLPEKKFLVEDETKETSASIPTENTPPPPYTSNPSSPAVHRSVKEGVKAEDVDVEMLDVEGQGVTDDNKIIA